MKQHLNLKEKVTPIVFLEPVLKFHMKTMQFQTPVK
jgi:hypothetical protein